MKNNTDEEENKSVSKGWFRAGIFTIILALLTPVLIMIASGTTFSVGKLGELGAVGDFFGGSTIGLLSIASIFFIIHTINIQSKELSLQRKELEYTKNELKQTREVHEESNKTQNNQRFETSFFNMITLQKEILNNLTYSEGHKVYTGRNYATFFYERFYNNFRTPPSMLLDKVNAEKNLKDQTNIIFAHTQHYYGDSIGPYFRNLYIIINFIDRSHLTTEEKKDYMEILKAQFSKIEMNIIFYYVSSTQGEDLKNLVMTYDFFGGHLKPGNLIHAKHYEFLSK